MKNILVISFSDLRRDARVDRQLRNLRPHYRVSAAGYGAPELEGIDFTLLRPQPKLWMWRGAGALRILLRRYERYYWNRSDVTECLRRLGARRADLVVANDIETLPVALRLARGVPVLFDAHEYAPLEFEERLLFRLFLRPYKAYLCRTYIPRAAAMMTVADHIAATYERDTGVHPEVVWNAADYQELQPSPSCQSDAKIRLVHHGGASPSRRTDQMLRMMAHLDQRFELYLILMSSDRGYLSWLRAQAGGDPRIHFLDPLPLRQLPRFLNQFDVGVYLLAPSSFNNRYALPNKFFDFVQARLAIAIGPSPEMAGLVEEYHLGVVAEDFTPAALARRLSRLDAAQIAAYKQHAHQAARQLSSESGGARLLGVVERMLRESEQGRRSTASEPTAAATGAGGAA
jgi:glycosyltransferase involved in cell wall biosynthesis